jgi:hypothetical protein
VIESEVKDDQGRTKAVLRAVGVPPSTCYRRAEAEPRRPGPAPRPLDEGLRANVVSFATTCPW